MVTGDYPRGTWASNTLTLTGSGTTSGYVEAGQSYFEQQYRQRQQNYDQLCKQYDYGQLGLRRSEYNEESSRRLSAAFEEMTQSATITGNKPVQQEKKPMRALWKVYIVDIKTEETWEFQVIATDEGKAKIKASWKWANVQPGRGDNLDNLDMKAIKLMDVRDADGDK